jgi:hypothetical protein
VSSGRIFGGRPLFRLIPSEHILSNYKTRVKECIPESVETDAAAIESLPISSSVEIKLRYQYIDEWKATLTMMHRIVWRYPCNGKRKRGSHLKIKILIRN